MGSSCALSSRGATRTARRHALSARLPRRAGHDGRYLTARRKSGPALSGRVGRVADVADPDILIRARGLTKVFGGVAPPSAGELTVLGLDPVRDGPAIRARLGVVPQEDTLDVELTVRENLLVYGRYFG